MPTTRRSERGSTTAEAALVLPTLVLFTAAMVWLVSLGVAQVRAVDAAREAARGVARGDPVGRAAGVGRRVAGAGSTVAVNDAGQVTAHVSIEVRGPGGVFAGLPTVTVHADAVAVREPGTDGPRGGSGP